MRPISEATGRITGKSFSRKHISLGRILTAWKDIAGPELAPKALPSNIVYRRKKKGDKPEIILEIAASSADSTLLHYQKGLILERINRIFGDGWISAIRFVAIASNAPEKRKGKAQTPLTQEQKDYLSGMLELLPDPDLKVRLEVLGQAIFTERKS